MPYKSSLSEEKLNLLAEREVISVSQLNKRARSLLEGSFATIWVEGEISNLSRPSSGHIYFSLKDSKAQIRCAMFKNRNQSLRFTVEAGMKVIARAKLSLYEPRGDYQLIVENLTESGLGALQRQFEQLKAELSARGWFALETKQALPVAPQHIGVITSANAAALQDIITVLGRRSPSTKITVFPCLVQGDEAPAQISDAIEQANHYAEELEPPISALIVGRGGGSLEDLWGFNTETVAAAIHHSELPIVSAVGHEIDFTIADFVADHRAPTPSAAAELLSIDQTELIERLKQLSSRLLKGIRYTLSHYQQTVNHLERGLTHPGQRINQQSQQLDKLEIRLHQLGRQAIQQQQITVNQQRRLLLQNTPIKRIAHYQQQINNLQRRLHQAGVTMQQTQRQKLSIAVEKLHAISPLATLARGYSITKDGKGKVITNANTVNQGDDITVQVAHGKIAATVVKGLVD